MKKMLTVALLCGGFAVMPFAFAAENQTNANEPAAANQPANAEQTAPAAQQGNQPNQHEVMKSHVASKSMMININTADAKMLSKNLKGIGLKKAEAIVAYRTEHGQFKTADDLTNVHGITKKIVDENRSRIQTAE